MGAKFPITSKLIFSFFKSENREHFDLRNSRLHDRRYRSSGHNVGHVLLHPVFLSLQQPVIIIHYLVIYIYLCALSYPSICFQTP